MDETMSAIDLKRKFLTLRTKKKSIGRIKPLQELKEKLGGSPYLSKFI